MPLDRDVIEKAAYPSRFTLLFAYLYRAKDDLIFSALGFFSQKTEVNSSDPVPQLNQGLILIT